jgi:hypothetical protein
MAILDVRSPAEFSICHLDGSTSTLAENLLFGTNKRQIYHLRSCYTTRRRTYLLRRTSWLCVSLEMTPKSRQRVLVKPTKALVGLLRT